MQVEDLQRLVTITMPYGKYKGRILADLPGHYLNWFAREGFPQGEIGRLLALIQEIVSISKSLKAYKFKFEKNGQF